MTEHSCPGHDYIPCVDVRAGVLMWPGAGRLLAEPRFPFFCLRGQQVEWLTAREAADQGLVHIAYVHSPS